MPEEPASEAAAGPLAAVSPSHLRPTVVVAAVDQADLGARLHSFLSLTEQQKADRFRFSADRNAYCAAHFMLRACLNAIVSPKDWRFLTGEYGKPYLDPACAIEGLEFNMSHSRGRVACAFSFDGPVGVDTEDDYLSFDLLAVASAVSSAAEYRALAELTEPIRPAAFARLWTVKEALAKALGKGMSIDPRLLPADPDAESLPDQEGCDGTKCCKVEHRRFGDSHVAVAILPTPEKIGAISFDWYQANFDQMLISYQKDVGLVLGQNYNPLADNRGAEILKRAGSAGGVGI